MRRGFTLIELLVVLAILSILAALIFPVFAGVREKSRQTVCASQLRQIGLALQMYQEDCGQMLSQKFVDSSRDPNWHDALMPYTHDASIFRCPNSPSRYPGEYSYRAELDLAKIETPYRPQKYMVRLSPRSVIISCAQHVERKTDKERQDGGFQRDNGLFVVLRADGSVQSVPAPQVRIWGYEDKKWVTPENMKFLSDYAPSFPVFPDEPWPPQFEK